MFEWLQRLIPTGRKRAGLPHFARVWLALETARKFTPLFTQHWPDTPVRYPRHLDWAHRAIWRHITGADIRPRLVRLATLQAFVAAGGAIRNDQENVSMVATITRCAAMAAEHGVDSSEQHLEETLSFAAHCAECFHRRDLWDSVQTISADISRLARAERWRDIDRIPADIAKSLG